MRSRPTTAIAVLAFAAFHHGATADAGETGAGLVKAGGSSAVALR